MRSAYAIVWLLAVAVAFGLAPPNRPDLWPWLGRLLTGDWAGENPLVVAHFQMMGLWPLAMAALWRKEWRRPGRLPAWPFLLGGFALGCFAILPYAALRRDRADGPPGVPAWVWGLIGIGFAGFTVWGLAAGDFGGWLAAVRSDGFMWPMAWDFALFAGLFAMESRGRLWGVRAG
jgi:hypothetical protein